MRTTYERRPEAEALQLRLDARMGRLDFQEKEELRASVAAACERGDGGEIHELLLAGASARRVLTYCRSRGRSAARDDGEEPTAYVPGTDAREAIATLERRGCPLLDSEKASLMELGQRLELEGATSVLRSHADHAASVRTILDTFRGVVPDDSACRTPGVRADHGRGCGCRRADERPNRAEMVKARREAEQVRETPGAKEDPEEREEEAEELLARAAKRHRDRMRNAWKHDGK